MPVKPFTAVAVACDVCGEDYEASFADVEAARSELADIGWLVATDERAICSWQNARHQAAIDRLLPTDPTTPIRLPEELPCIPRLSAPPRSFPTPAR